jgi:hypothetical protein
MAAARAATTSGLSSAARGARLQPLSQAAASTTTTIFIKHGAAAPRRRFMQQALNIDRAECSVAIPEEFQTTLASDPEAAALFARLAPSHRQEYANWVGGAKNAETRATRAGRAIAMITGGSA